MSSPLLVAFLGSAAMAVLALGLWLPAYLRHRALTRRLSGFVQADTASGFALDLGGRRRARIRRQVVGDRNRWLVRHVGRMITQAQVDVSIGEVIAAMAVLSLLTFTLSAIWSGFLIVGGLAGGIAAAAPLAWLHWRRRRVERRFETQLLDTIALLSSSVRSGHSLLQALEHVTSEAPEPTRSAIGLVVREIGLGASQEDALERLADRLPSEDLELIVSAVNVHHQIGGSLAKVLDSIAQTIRERVRVAGDIRGLTAQQRYSAYVLSLLPVVAAGALMAFSPDYVSVLFAPGPLRIVMIAAAAMVVVGFLVMNRMARIDV
ncbi:MAG TPA: type II secretion system F family protein [Candidatus Limnocylindria bacterium]